MYNGDSKIELKGNYIGSIIENDLERLHRPGVGKVYFEEFKKIIKQNNFTYKAFSESRAQILDISFEQKHTIRVYYTGGMVWWGFHGTAIEKMMEVSPQCPCYLLMYADSENLQDRHYWWCPIVEEDVNQFKGSGNWRWLFSEPVKGKLQLPLGLKDKKVKKNKAAQVLDILNEMIGIQ